VFSPPLTIIDLLGNMLFHHLENIERSVRLKKTKISMSLNLGESLLGSKVGTPRSMVSQSGNPGIPRMSREKLSQANKRHIQMFLHGGESSMVTEQGDYNIHRMVPKFLKFYLNWTRDTFPSIVRLSWGSLMLLFVSIKLFTIAVFAAIMRSLDGLNGQECVTNASSYMDFFYFVVHTIFTIGYGSMSPVCHWSNLMVTIISFFGMFQTATFTGIFFAKFSMDPRRNFACAFTTKLVGIPPASQEEDRAGDDMVRLNFRFVNVFHRRYFKVSCRLYLIEHRMHAVTEHWLPPVVEELNYFDTSAPMEFMSLPIEVCLYVPFNRLVRQQPSPLATPLLSPRPAPFSGRPTLPSCDKPRHHSYQQWIRHYSREFKNHRADSDPATPRLHSTIRDPDVPINSEFEVMCMLVFTDATTGCEIAVRKSWALADSIWLSQSESNVKWKNIVFRDEKSDQYLVDVTGLDFIDNQPDTVLPTLQEEPSFGFKAASPSNRDIAYRLINTMTMPARGSQVRHTQTGELFPSPLPEESV
jgi:hypothetical protein